MASVGSMATVWHGVVNPPRTAQPRTWRYDDAPILLRQGQEMGRFLLGSAVVMLFPKGRTTSNPDWAPGGTVRLGEQMAQREESGARTERASTGPLRRAAPRADGAGRQTGQSVRTPAPPAQRTGP